ncbi:hypothetical protein FB446DRAFT_745518 [Lentinula raphanica]|nr:hypothetical protein FB446DRAFT_745518 [Lentinula raphanica]
MQPLLPNELLHSIIDYIAFIPKLPNSRSKSPFKCASPELLALSVTNWQLRRVCLPFLFAHVKIEEDSDLQQLGDHLARSVEFTKVLVLDSLTHLGDHILSEILPQLEQLSEVELRDCQDRTDLLRTILVHPTVTSVLVDELPDASMCDDNLSKVALPRTRAYRAISPEYEKYLDQGMRILCLELVKHGSLGSAQLETKIPFGTKEISIIIHGHPDSLSWLPTLSSNRPTLNEVSLLGGRQSFDHVTLPFWSPFIKESRRQKLLSFFNIKRMGLRKTTGSYPQEWYVRGLTLQTTTASTSLIEILTLVASSFRKLEKLTLRLDLHEELYDIGDLVAVLAQFPSLRVVYFDKVFGRLKFGPETERLMPPVRQLDTPGALDALKAHAESGLMLFASILATRARSLDSIHINDTAHEHDSSGNPIGSWHLIGWLHILNGNRDIGGTLA